MMKKYFRPFMPMLERHPELKVPYEINQHTFNVIRSLMVFYNEIS
jgi:hypothetical protein